MRPIVNMGVLALACVFVLGACADDGGEDSGSSGAEPWNESDATWMQPAGTPLTAGMTVPEGARLVGPVFTLLADQEVKVASQRGFLLADGDPYAVASDFVEQWDGANSPGDYHRGTLCRQQVDEGVEGKTKSYDYTGDPEPGAAEISCAVGLVLREPKGESELEQIRSGRSLNLSLENDLTAPDQPAQGTVDWQQPFAAIPDELPVAPDGVDGPATVASDVDYLPDLTIVDGSFLAGPPPPAGGTGGYVAVIGVTGDSDDVFDAYVAQDTDEPYFTADTMIGGMRIRVFRSAEAGGIWNSVTLNEIDGNSWILVAAYND